ncbi:glutamate--tRNA ligase [Chenggangzhangella methanolivorans]|uniref:Glutamate--tRNA ligase n=1 Tax=Chenggangzhangella methanolivorans TaxID=1437009 RepID=A0A9E6UQA6_9HYPH|nr:glutamate--tRNA ligase [Chenggangzhangella methanolivorans]QZO00710.1 glutamate--tRNA ligase [Chenggangzhangella methanolivorans]
MTTFRFAPSPTGRLHLGNARTLLLNALMAKKTGGRFVLRIDDTDVERSREEYVEAIREDLAWLGLTPALEVRQSERATLYEQAFAKLGDRVYPAYETEEELDRARRLARASGRPPIYDRSALKLTPEKRAAFEAEGRCPHWRFRLTGGRVAWDDGVRGAQEIDLSSLSDPVIRRDDGTFLYVFTSVVDDAALGITDIVRGEDHVANSAVQLDLFAALAASAPRLAHHNLLTTADGAGLSKRSGALSLGTLREEGIEPLAVAAYATLIGSAEAVRPVGDLDELAGLIDLSRLSRAPARIDPEELAALSAKTAHALPFEIVAPRLAALGVGGGAAFWETVRGNLRTVAEAADWWRIATDDAFSSPAAAEDDRPLLVEAARLLPDEPWDETTWKSWTAALGAAAGRKGRGLFLPLRLALTGEPGGPELARLLPFVGRARALARLEAAAG